jgi:lysophospholipase L1-like esterase
MPRRTASFLLAGFLAALLLLGPVGTTRAAEDALAPAPAELAILQQKLADIGHPLVWVMTGDSITHGAKWLGNERSYPELIQERVRWSLKRRRDLFINSGISGERTTGLLADFEWRVLHFKPDIVSIMIGMNNAVLGPEGRKPFEVDLREMIRQVRGAGAIPVLHRTNPIDLESGNPAALSRADVPAYNEVIAAVARELDVILVDHWTHWQRAKPTPLARRDWLADPIHPNGAGHRQFSIEFFRTIGLYDPSAPDCQP